MAAIEDFVKRLTRMNRRFTFIFTEDFFASSIKTDRFRDIRTIVKNTDHRKGLNAMIRADEDTVLFDVQIAVIRNGFSCFMTTFQELAMGPYADSAMIYGEGAGLVDAQKAKFQVESFLSEKSLENLPTAQMITENRKRQMVLVVESAADLKRPSLEPIRKLRSQLVTILISPVKGPVVDCQVTKLFQEGNSNSFSCLMNMFSVNYR